MCVTIQMSCEQAKQIIYNLVQGYFACNKRDITTCSSGSSRLRIYVQQQH